MPGGPQAKNLWSLTQSRLRKRLDEHSYKNWFSQTQFESFEDGELRIAVPSRFFADWLRDHYLDTVLDCAREELPDLKSVRFVVGIDMASPHEEAAHGGENGRHHSAPAAPPARPVSREGAPQAEPAAHGFNPRYTFSRFVVGAGNRFAHAAARAVAETPSRAYNPLFLYGATGLGKTHLMQAIGQEILHRRADLQIAFVSSEHFTNQLIESIARKSTQRFRARYRKVDVLLIDDIHFIAGKEATQEEFFHTFNVLFDNHKQIVLSSDRPPKEINGLEERLVSRFEWGLVTDIQPPDLETRVAILQNKAREEGHTVDNDVLRHIATYITWNIRELEGALVTLMAYARLTEQRITVDLADEVLHDLIGRYKVKPVTVDSVQRAVAEHFDVRIADLRGRSRQRQVAFPRQVAMFLCKELIPSLSLSEVGEAFGGKDHTTVLYACQKIGDLGKSSRETQQVLGHLRNTIQQA